MMNKALRCWVLGLLLADISLAAANESPQPLEEGQGYLLLALNVEQGYIPTRVLLSGDGWGTNTNLYDINRMMNYWLLPLDAGSYQWDRVYLAKRSYLELDSDNLVLKVEAGRINYGGHLVLNTTMTAQRSELGDGGAWYKFSNQASQALRYLEKEHPGLLQQFGLQYQGKERDHFLDFMASLGEGAL